MFLSSRHPTCIQTVSRLLHTVHMRIWPVKYRPTSQKTSNTLTLQRPVGGAWQDQNTFLTSFWNGVVLQTLKNQGLVLPQTNTSRRADTHPSPGSHQLLSDTQRLSIGRHRLESQTNNRLPTFIMAQVILGMDPIKNPLCSQLARSFCWDESLICAWKAVSDKWMVTYGKVSQFSTANTTHRW